MVESVRLSRGPQALRTGESSECVEVKWRVRTDSARRQELQPRLQIGRVPDVSLGQYGGDEDMDEGTWWLLGEEERVHQENHGGLDHLII